MRCVVTLLLRHIFLPSFTSKSVCPHNGLVIRYVRKVWLFDLLEVYVCTLITVKHLAVGC